MHFDPRDLELFRAIAQHSSLTKAAHAQHFSVAAASARVHALEAQAGLPLLIRKARGVSLTPAGESFLHHARALLRQTEELRADMREYTRGLRGQVRVHANTTATTDILPSVLPPYLTAHPQVNVELRERQNREIVTALRDGQADLGIVSMRIDAPGLRGVHFSTDELMLVVPSGHRFAERRSIAFAKSLEEPQIGMHAGSTLREQLASATEDLGRPLRLRVELSSFDAVCRMVAAGVGIGVVPAISAAHHLAQGTIVQVALTDPWRVRERHVMMREADALPPYAQALVDALVAWGSTSSEATVKHSP